MGLTKKQRATQFMQAHDVLLQCPVCSERMTVDDNGTVRCANNHAFDMAKQGYVNMMTHPATSMYDKSLFEARKEVIDSDLYRAVYDVILAELQGDVVMLDTGCGEGSHLAKLRQSYPQQLVASGIDIAKEGIMQAAKNYSDMMWIVGDLAKSPYSEAAFDVILNFLSPANYTEFRRILKPGGKVIKIVPQEGYLRELRALFFADSEKESYSNEKTVTRFSENFDAVRVERVTTTLPIEASLVPLLAHMTPMGWHQEQAIDPAKLTHITIDVDVLIGE